MIPIPLIFTILTWIYTSRHSEEHCSINIKKDFGNPQPLILQNSSPERLLEPIDGTGILTIAAGEAIRLACTGANNYLINVDLNNTKDAQAVCINGKIFRIGLSEFDISSLICNNDPEHTIKITNKRCLDKYTNMEIGFELTSEFLRIIEICRNDETYTTYYAMAEMNKAIGAYQASPRPYWQAGNFYSKYNMEYQYKRKTQIKTIENIVDSEDLAKYYIQTTGDLYYSRGHLVAKSDLVYGIAQQATFWYLNSAPQWQSFNGGNWNVLEQNVRDFVVNQNLNVQIYTGVHGQQTLADKNDVPREVFFYATKTVRDLIVPKYFWKLVYDPANKKATAFVGVNDPYTDYHENPICEDISKDITWLSWRPNNITLGISYACSYGDLRKAIPTIPVLDVIGTLELNTA